MTENQIKIIEELIKERNYQKAETLLNKLFNNFNLIFGHICLVFLRLKVQRINILHAEYFLVE